MGHGAADISNTLSLAKLCSERSIFLKTERVLSSQAVVLIASVLPVNSAILVHVFVFKTEML